MVAPRLAPDRLTYARHEQYGPPGVFDTRGYSVVEVLDLEPDLRHAQLVSSATSCGAHAPALDLDRPALLTRDTSGPTLWLSDLEAASWRQLRHLLSEHGLAAPLTGPLRTLRRHPTHNARTHALHRVARTVDDPDPSVQVMTELAHSGTHTFTAVLAASTAAAAARTTLDERHAALAADPWPVPLSVPAHLLPSTRNHHLYLQTTTTWPAYSRLLRGLAEIAVVEPGYASVSIERQRSHLRLPWVRKTVSPATAPF